MTEHKSRVVLLDYLLSARLSEHPELVVEKTRPLVLLCKGDHIVQLAFQRQWPCLLISGAISARCQFSDEVMALWSEEGGAGRICT